MSNSDILDYGYLHRDSVVAYRIGQQHEKFDKRKVQENILLRNEYKINNADTYSHLMLNMFNLQDTDVSESKRIEQLNLENGMHRMEFDVKHKIKLGDY